MARGGTINKPEVQLCPLEFVAPIREVLGSTMIGIRSMFTKQCAVKGQGLTASFLALSEFGQIQVNGGYKKRRRKKEVDFF